MNKQTLWRRVGLLAALAIVMTIALTNAPFAHAQEGPSGAGPVASPVGPPQGEDGTITITARMCPEEYAGDAHDADCTGVPPAGAEFTIIRKDGFREPVAIDGSGVAVLPLPAADTPGMVGLSFVLPGYYHGVDSVVFCVDDEGGRVPVRNANGHIGIGIVATADGMAISCAWFLIPDRIGPGDPATATFVNLICPPGYKGVDYAADCVTPAPEGKKFVVAVRLDEFDRVGVAGDTGPDGVATIPIPYADQVLPGEIYLGQWINPKNGETEEDLDPFVATCTRNDGAEVVPVGEDGPNSIAVDALVDDAITCIWYNLPPPA